MLIYWAAMVHATPKYNIYIYHFDEYVPITVILLMLSETRRLVMNVLGPWSNPVRMCRCA